MKTVIAMSIVAAGGAAGSVMRYLIGLLLSRKSLAEGGFPFGTFTVNLLGSLLIGIVLGYTGKNSSPGSYWQLLLATGVCGGFTTFSSFAWENFQLLKNGHFLLFAFYSIITFTLCIFSVFLGLFIAKHV